MESKPPVISYATPESRSAGNAKYAIASICIGGFCLLWSITDTPMDPLKHDKIGAILSVIGIILAFGAFKKSNRRRRLATVGLVICVLAFVMNWFFPAWG
jgi:uncharacterized membrane protein HdeD (DUF308 family)